MWQERGRLVKELKTARKENKSIIKNAIQEIDDTVESRNKQIDALHARANELKNANLEREQALLERLEKAYAKTPEAKSKQAIAAARANVGKTEAAIRVQQERQLKEKRAAEQQALEFKEALPVTRQKIVETRAKVKGTKEDILQKKVTVKEVPETKAEKRAEATAKAKEGAAERVADKKAIAARLEQGLSGTVANAKEQLITLEAKLAKVEKDIKKSLEDYKRTKNAPEEIKYVDQLKSFNKKKDELLTKIADTIGDIGKDAKPEDKSKINNFTSRVSTKKKDLNIIVPTPTKKPTKSPDKPDEPESVENLPKVKPKEKPEKDSDTYNLNEGFINRVKKLIIYN
jgi:DNA repair exonuclease SbcCD ATPase subunit